MICWFWKMCCVAQIQIRTEHFWLKKKTLIKEAKNPLSKEEEIETKRWWWNRRLCFKFWFRNNDVRHALNMLLDKKKILITKGDVTQNMRLFEEKNTLSKMWFEDVERRPWMHLCSKYNGFDCVRSVRTPINVHHATNHQSYESYQSTNSRAHGTCKLNGVKFISLIPRHDGR